MRINRSALLALILLSLIWGYSWIIMKIALGFSGPFQFAALRTGLGGASLFAVLHATKRPLRPPQALADTLWLGLLQTTGFLALSMWALMEGGAGKTAILVFTMPFWLMLMAWPALCEKIQGLQWVAVVLALTGLVLILEPWNLHTSLLSKTLAVLAGICWAASAVIAKRLQNRVQVDLINLTAWQMILGAIPLIAISLIVPAKPVIWSGYFIGALIFSGVVTTALGWVLWLYVLNHLPAGSASLNSLAIPVIAILSSWAQLGEQPKPMEWGGMLLIAIALGLISTRAIRQHRQVDPQMGQE
jgi:drug/metabolite transporter (DMT)-like permease